MTSYFYDIQGADVSRNTLKQLLQQSYDAATVQTNGRSTIRQTTIDNVTVPNAPDKVSIGVPQGSEVYFSSRESRDDWRAIIFLGDWHGSVVYVQAAPHKPGLTIEPMLRGRMLLAAKTGQTQLFPADHQEVRTMRKQTVVSVGRIY